jgi:hypothetical protein
MGSPASSSDRLLPAFGRVFDRVARLLDAVTDGGHSFVHRLADTLGGAFALTGATREGNGANDSNGEYGNGAVPESTHQTFSFVAAFTASIRGSLSQRDITCLSDVGRPSSRPHPQHESFFADNNKQSADTVENAGAEKGTDRICAVHYPFFVRDRGASPRRQGHARS